ncbi:hypothetical protein F5Y04DRAFT_283269 [Hypomontagnella monticulosa]|nr:hypothetical protein F5Y04DRAFT_283269 [Hypomontagnella monticulosa]
MDDTSIQHEPSFGYFRLLPLELRLEIWRYCLPSRVMEVHAACYGASLDGEIFDDYQEEGGTLVRAKPPLVSRVCRESRSVALEHGGLEPIGPSLTNVWFDKSTDSLSFNPYHLRMFLTHNIIYDDHIELPPTIQKLLSDSTIPFCTDGSFVRSLANGNNAMMEWMVEHALWRTECTVVINRLSLHMGYQDACDSGLFGLFAESSPAYIDVRDVSTKHFSLV